MDRRLKERLIGASILVLLAVILVPEMLSGPKPRFAPPAAAARIAGLAPDAMHTFTVAVPTGSGSGAGPAADAKVVPAAVAPSVATPAAAVAATTPPKAVATADSTSPAVPAAAAPAPPQAPTPAPTPTATPAAAPITPAAPIRKGAWAVQVGSFANAANAKKIMRELAGKGYAVYTVQSGQGKHTQHKVRIGPEADRAAAERILAKLKSDGHTGAVVAP